MLEEAIVSENVNFFLLIRNKKNGTFPHSETVFHQLTGSIFERERQMFTTHPQAKVQTLFFDKFKTLACTTLLYFGSVILTYLPQDSVQKSLIFCILSIIPETRALFCPFFLSCVHTYILYCMFESLRPKARLHLNTSWKTRHLVFSHITSENS